MSLEQEMCAQWSTHTKHWLEIKLTDLQGYGGYKFVELLRGNSVTHQRRAPQLNAKTLAVEWICVLIFQFHSILGTDPKYLTTVIPYHLDNGPPDNQTLQALIKSKNYLIVPNLIQFN